MWEWFKTGFMERLSGCGTVVDVEATMPNKVLFLLDIEKQINKERHSVTARELPGFGMPAVATVISLMHISYAEIAI